MNVAIPIVKDIVLLGGGHSHALLIRRWAMSPLPGVRLTLISEGVLTPYSGMLPGYIAGHYSSEDIHIDISRLCCWANVRFIEATITGIDLPCQQVLLSDRPSFGYDVLSIDTGSTPETRSIAGADRYTIPVKPINQLQSRWQAFRRRQAEQQAEQRTAPLVVAVVGSGVGGFELATAIDHVLNVQHNSSGRRTCNLHWILRGEMPIRSRPRMARRLALKTCNARGITVHTGFDVTQVSEGKLHARDDREFACDEIFWCTAAAAARWPTDSGLQADDKGFIATNAYLQSISHPNVFATGDVATQIDTPSEKSGVFAVRQAPILFENLRRYISDQRLKRFRPQKNTLSLMALGSKRAIATHGKLTVSGDWVWRWKDCIDRSFMDKFSDLPQRQMAAPTLAAMPAVLRSQIQTNAEATELARRCGGCGAKVPAVVLHRVLKRLQPISRSDVLQGIDPPGDTAVIKTAGFAMAQSIDQLRAMLDDPWLFGRIAALHALSDLFAMSAKPQSAMALVTLPYATPEVMERELTQMMSGALFELNRHQCVLTGGHSSEGAELSLGFAVNGWLGTHYSAVAKLKPGDCLVLTKALGTGVILSGHMQLRARGVDVHACIRNMLVSNADAAALFSIHGYSAMTDVTGFGLLGHLVSILKLSELACTLNAAAIPLLPGALALSESGVQSTLLPSNLTFMQELKFAEASNRPSDPSRKALFCDPQTSGGLLAGIPESAAEDCLAALKQAGYADAAIIGRVQEANSDGAARILLIDSEKEHASHFAL